MFLLSGVQSGFEEDWCAVYVASLQETLTVVRSAHVPVDNVAHRGPDRQAGSQCHHLARAQGALVTFLHCIHDTLRTQRDAPPKQKQGNCLLSGHCQGWCLLPLLLY